MNEFHSLKDERALMEKLASDLRERSPKTTEKWESAPPSLALMGPQSSVTVERGSLWQPYGTGKLCEHDDNARSELRRLQNDV